MISGRWNKWVVRNGDGVGILALRTWLRGKKEEWQKGGAGTVPAFIFWARENFVFSHSILPATRTLFSGDYG